MKHKSFSEQVDSMVKALDPSSLTPDEQAELERVALAAAANFGAPERLLIPDPLTGEYVLIDMNDPSPEAIEYLKMVIKRYENRSGAV